VPMDRDLAADRNQGPIVATCLAPKPMQLIIAFWGRASMSSIFVNSR